MLIFLRSNLALCIGALIVFVYQTRLIETVLYTNLGLDFYQLLELVRVEILIL
jgi:hypothetical protein